MSANLERVQCLIALAAISVGAFAANPPATAPPTKDEIHRAWARRQSSIQSINASYSIVESRPGQKQARVDLNDPFREFSAKSDMQLRRTYSFKFKEGRLAAELDGDAIFQDGTIGRQINSAAFNGKEYRTFVQGQGLPMGSFDRRGRVGGQLTSEINNLAIWLWFDPARLMEKVIWEFGDLKSSENKFTVDGVECWQLELTRKGPVWRSDLYVDNSVERLPRQWDMIYKGVATFRLNIEYQTDSEGRSFVSKWRVLQNSDKGKLKSHFVAEVKHFRINRFIDDKSFELEFPVGTHVDEERDGSTRFYIKEKSGLRRIKESEYGRRPDKDKVIRLDANGRTMPTDLTAAPAASACGSQLPETRWQSSWR